jgi:hypothetical protein
MTPPDFSETEFSCPACGCPEATAAWRAIIPQPIRRDGDIYDMYDWDEWDTCDITFEEELFVCGNHECTFSSWTHKSFIPQLLAESDRQAAMHPVSNPAREAGRRCAALRSALLVQGPGARNADIKVSWQKPTTATAIVKALQAVDPGVGDVLRVAALTGAPDGAAKQWIAQFTDQLQGFVDGEPLLAEVLGGLSVLEAAWWVGACPAS